MLQFDENFFEGEEREGFYVEPMMKKAWAAQLEVLQVVDEICERNNITYYADWGTLLGAVRHKGFIPWDDDVDIAMKRVDYERFLKIAEKELPPEWDILTLNKFYDWNRCIARVVNTQQVPLKDSRIQEFHGFPFMAGVDIFPIDNMPTEKAEQDFYIELLNVVRNLAYAWDKGNPDENMANLKGIEECCNVRFTEDKPYEQQLWGLADRISSMYYDLGEETEEVVQFYNLIEDPNFRIPVSCYDSVVRVPFENITVPAPVGYHQILTIYYGDYMIPVQGTADHKYPFYNEQRKEIVDEYKGKGIEMPESMIQLLEVDNVTVLR